MGVEKEDLSTRREAMEEVQAHGEDRGLESEPPPADEGEVQAWEQIEAGRYMPRRIRGSCRGRTLG
jgi:hypothetical protein